MLVNHHTFRVIYGDTDKMGVVYYANYLRYFEAGRNEFLRNLGVEYKKLEELGYALPVADVSVKYHQPAYYDDELELETSLATIRLGSVVLRYRLARKTDGVLLATGETKHACIGPSGRISRLPDDLRAKLDAAVRPEEEV